VLLERGREILAAVDSAIEDARRAARGEYGRLAIGFTGSCTYAMLPALAAALRRELPGVVLDLRGELLTPAQVTRSSMAHSTLASYDRRSTSAD
jgi:DNA-binding transcriptional LysR family regulator